MIDTSVLVAALIDDHVHHSIARARLSSATQVPAIVLAETYAQLRRTFAIPADVAAGALRRWTATPATILTTTAAAVMTVFGRAAELDLGGNIHDALIAQTCIEHGLGLSTLDRRQHRIALALGTASELLAPAG